MKSAYSLIGCLLFFTCMLYAAEPNTIYWNMHHGYEPFDFATPDGIKINNQTANRVMDKLSFESPLNDFKISFRASNSHGNPSKKYPYVSNDGIIRKTKEPTWGFFIALVNGDSIFFTVDRTDKEGMINSHTSTLIRVTSASGLPIFCNEAIADETDSHTGINLWQLFASPDGITLSGGHRKQANIIHLSGVRSQYSGFGFFANPASDITITDISLSKEVLPVLRMSCFSDYNSIVDYCMQSSDDTEGIWMMFDRELEESLLKPGGDYTLAIIRNEDLYLLIYLSGATVNSSQWQTGMIKGFLYPTPFDGIFDAEWIDAEGIGISNGVKVQTGEGGTLTFQFPYHSSSLRLRKAPLKKL